MSRAIALLRQSSYPLLIAHPRPDGDALGCALALRLALLRLGKQPWVACIDPIPDTFAYLPGVESFIQTLPPAVVAQTDLIIAVDLGDSSRTGGLYPPDPARRIPLLVIDHHPPHEGFGDVKIVDPTAPSTASVMVEVFDALEIPIDGALATCLLTGLLTDTRGLRTENVTPEVFALVNRLMQAGGNYQQVVRNALDAIPYVHLRAWGYALNRLHLEDGVVWATLTLEEKGTLGIEDYEELNLSNFISATQGAVLAASLVEMHDGTVRVSLRARNGYDVATLARMLHGGGHRQAAGCTLEGPLEAAVAQLLPLLHQERERGRRRESELSE